MKMINTSKKQIFVIIAALVIISVVSLVWILSKDTQAIVYKNDIGYPDTTGCGWNNEVGGGASCSGSCSAGYLCASINGQCGCYNLIEQADEGNEIDPPWWL